MESQPNLWVMHLASRSSFLSYMGISHRWALGVHGSSTKFCLGDSTVVTLKHCYILAQSHLQDDVV